jgi:hypothetical protein
MTTLDLVRSLGKIAEDIYRAAQRRDTDALVRLLQELETSSRQLGISSNIDMLSHRVYNTIASAIAQLTTDPVTLAVLYTDVFCEYGLREVLVGYLKKLVLPTVEDQDKSTFCYVLATILLKLIGVDNLLRVAEPLSTRYMHPAQSIALFRTASGTLRATICKIAALYCAVCSNMFDLCLETLCPPARDRLR